MSDPRDWRYLCADVMLENENTQVLLRIERAEDSIPARLRELPATSTILSDIRLFGVLAFASREPRAQVGGESSGLCVAFDRRRYTLSTLKRGLEAWTKIERSNIEKSEDRCPRPHLMIATYLH
jgi:hypothetical protein